MNIQQLKYVIALDNHRHFVKAAESCFVAQPTLTLQVKKLEDEIGITLFDRSKQPIEPTTMGKIFIQKAREIIREINNLKELVNTEREVLKGTFTLGIIPTLAPYLLPRFIKKYCEMYPDVNLTIREMQSKRIIEGLKGNTIDFGIMATPTGESSIREIPLFHEPFWVYACKGHQLLDKAKINPEDITENGLWLLNEGHCFREQVLNICNNRTSTPVHPGLTFESGSIETIKNMIRGDMGYTLIPELSINSSIDEGLIRPFEHPQPTREISIVIHLNYTKEAILNSIRNSILENTPKHFNQTNKYFTVKWR